MKVAHSMSRTANSIKNIKYSIIGQVVGLLASFITRMVFVRMLSAEYLGINGLFTNILSILAFAELGIGPAIVYSMYKPLAEKDTKMLKGLMSLYKRAYITIGIFILVLGSALTPFIDFFITEVPDVNNLQLIYLLFVVHTSASYFFSYKRSFLIADQQKYIDAFYHSAYLIIRNVLQILVLLVLQNYILFLSVQIIVTFIENLRISNKVDKMYPYIKNNKGGHIDKSVVSEIIKNIKAMAYHKVGSVVISGTDSLVIARFVGIVEVGLYSNYLLITEALKQVFKLIFQSIIASVGNLGATEDTKKSELIFRRIDFLGMYIFGFSFIALLSLLNPFIELWVGEGYLFPINTVVLIVINFYLYGRRRSVLTFRDALGLFWYDRHKPIVESIINLSASIILVNIIGFNGVILGTIISTLTTSFWVEPFVLYKYGFNLSMRGYFKRYLIWTIVIMMIGSFNFWLVNLFDNSILLFVGKVIITAIVPNILMALIYWKTNEAQYFYHTIKSLIERKTS